MSTARDVFIGLVLATGAVLVAPSASAKPGLGPVTKSATKPTPTATPKPRIKRMKRGALKYKPDKLYKIDPCGNNTQFEIGRGIYDITGPAAESQLLGYANSEQQSHGIHTRLWSRAFVVSSACSGQRVVFVAADLGMLFQSVKQGVVAKLKKKYGNLYNDDNVILSATHTHHGPAGHSHYALYNVTGALTRAGFDENNYDTIVDGIYKSIVRAHDNRTMGTIKLSGGDVLNASMQRSPTAYVQNPDRTEYGTNVDQRMTLLRFDRNDGVPLGMVNWFAVHPTNFSKDNRFITGDNKGIAAFWFEKDFGTSYTSGSTFVGAFANANEGDVSPNLWGVPNGSHDASRARTIAKRQYDKAKQLFDSATTLEGGVQVVHRYVDFSKQTVGGKFTGAGTKKTCTAALGIAFAAGSTEDGPGESELLFEKVYEGMPYNGKNRVVLPGTPQSWLDELQPCHAEKDVLMPIGKTGWLTNPYPWTPEVLPVQLARIGPLAIAAVPFECTTMCGRRIRKTVLDVLGEVGVKEVVIAGLSNAYAGYVATRQEYAVQHYEGASTHFGPWTLAALRQEFEQQALAIRNRTSLSAGPTPRNLSGVQIENSGPGVVFDDKPIGKDFGDVDQEPNTSYARGKTARAVFWGAHPKNDYRTGNTFLQVQRKISGKWVEIARDTDQNTTYKWQRSGVANSKVTIDWKIPSDATLGTYRLVHRGNYKHGLTGDIHDYVGASRSFSVY